MILFLGVADDDTSCADELEVDSECRRGGALVGAIIICARVGGSCQVDSNNAPARFTNDFQCLWAARYTGSFTAPMGLPVNLSDASLVNHTFIIAANEGARLLIDGVGKPMS